MKSAVGAALAEAKIEADKVATAIEHNLKALADEAAGYEFLFIDLQQIISKPHCDFINLVKLRKADHLQAEEARKNAERLQAEQASQAKSQQDNGELHELPNALQSSEGEQVAAKNTAISVWANTHGVSDSALSELADILKHEYNINIAAA